MVAFARDKRSVMKLKFDKTTSGSSENKEQRGGREFRKVTKLSTTHYDVLTQVLIFNLKRAI